MRLSHNRPREANSLWLVIFSDMSTNLMMFFLMLFAMTRMSAPDRDLLVEGMKEAMQKKPQIHSIARKDAEALAIMTLKDVISYGRLSSYTSMSITDDKVKLTIEMPFLFKSGSAKINEAALKELESLVEPLTRFTTSVIVEGHTDNVPIRGGRYKSNWELSVARAVRVIDFLVSRGIPPKRLIAGGYGEYHPAHANDTPGNRALNRRIEITIPRQDASIESSQKNRQIR